MLISRTLRMFPREGLSHQAQAAASTSRTDAANTLRRLPEAFGIDLRFLLFGDTVF